MYSHCYVIYFYFFCLIETGFCYAVQAGPELTFVTQAGLKLSLILLPQPPKCWDYRRLPPHLAYYYYYYFLKDLFILFYFLVFCFIYSLISMAGSACPGGRAGEACGAGDRTVVPTAAAAYAFLSRCFRPLSHPAGPHQQYF